MPATARLRGKDGAMRQWLSDLDRILRGEATRLPALRDGTIELPVGRLGVVLAALGVVYGLCMGCFALFKSGGPSYLQLAASTSAMSCGRIT